MAGAELVLQLSVLLVQPPQRGLVLRGGFGLAAVVGVDRLAQLDLLLGLDLGEAAGVDLVDVAELLVADVLPGRVRRRMLDLGRLKFGFPTLDGLGFPLLQPRFGQRPTVGGERLRIDDCLRKRIIELTHLRLRQLVQPGSHSERQTQRDDDRQNTTRQCIGNCHRRHDQDQKEDDDQPEPAPAFHPARDEQRR